MNGDIFISKIYFAKMINQKNLVHMVLKEKIQRWGNEYHYKKKLY